jgi:lipopolysaccharide export system protein LptA
MKRVSLFLSILLLTLPLSAEAISFKGGYTKVRMQDGKKEIVLSGGAQVQTGSLSLSAKTITLSGDDYDRISLSGDVTVVDTEQGLTMQSPAVGYVRSTGVLSVQSWVEIDDTTNEISASAGSLSFNRQTGLMQLEGQVRLLRAASKGIMHCTSDTLTYDRDHKRLQLAGDAVITWNGDVYQAHVITVDLDSEEIQLEGSIKGTVHG